MLDTVYLDNNKFYWRWAEGVKAKLEKLQVGIEEKLETVNIENAPREFAYKSVYKKVWQLFEGTVCIILGPFFLKMKNDNIFRCEWGWS